MTHHPIPAPPAPATVLAAFAAIGLPGVHIDEQYRRNAESGWYLRVHLPPVHTAACIAGNRRDDLHAALGWPGRLWALPDAADPYDLALVFHDPDDPDDLDPDDFTGTDSDEKDDTDPMNIRYPYPVPDQNATAAGVTPMRTPDAGRPFDRPLSRPRRILAVPTLAATLGLLPVTAHAAAASWHRTAGHATLLAVLVTIVAAIAGIRGLAVAWRGPEDIDTAGPVFDGLTVAVVVAAGLTHHWPYAGMLAAGWLAFSMVIGFYPARMDGRSEHVTAAYATAWTAREAAAYARRLVDDPAHDGITAAGLVEELVRHAHQIAAHASGDADDLPDPDPDCDDAATVCATCHTPTTTRPCPEHQRFATHHQEATR